MDQASERSGQSQLSFTHASLRNGKNRVVEADFQDAQIKVR